MDGFAESKKILVTGASGFIGRATLEALVHNNLSGHIYLTQSEEDHGLYPWMN